MKWLNCRAAIAAILVLQSHLLGADGSDPLGPWRSSSEVQVKRVAPHTNRHVIHSYFNTCPESPDGGSVVYYTSITRDGENGDIRLLDRASGTETVIATDITTEDAHRAACQQWCNAGKTIVFHDCDEGRWHVKAFDVATRQIRVIATDRQVGIPTANSPWVPIYGCHWKPGPYRDIELVHVESGEIRTAVTVESVLAEYGDWIGETFLSHKISLFFPIMGPGDNKVLFKLALPGGKDDFRSGSASLRKGLVIYDLEENRFIRLIEKWGHPAWMPDGSAIFQKGNWTIDLATGKKNRHSPSCFSNHPSVSPDAGLFVTDADVSKRGLGNPGDWAIGVASMEGDDHVVLDIFGNTKGAKTWRPNHPHPVFSADGKRVYYNVNEGRWTTLMVASTGRK